MNIYNNGKMYFFFSFFSIVENSKKINNICGESKSSYKEREEKGRTHINFLLFFIFFKKQKYIFL